ncbi:MAG TPA: hypothetical protein VNM14_14185 [Planctomycetota bacterium]|jgi:hypothetical protein|nr:hypothetical protein [Planctomycetota bacterium]
MNRRLFAIVLLLLGATACSTPEFIPVGAPTRPLRSFDRIDAAALRESIPKKDPPPVQAPPSPSAFLQSFRKDLILRLHRKQVFDAPSGPVLMVEGSLLRYETGDRKPSGKQDTDLFAGFVDLDVVLRDEKGTRIGGGRASVIGTGSTPDMALSNAEKKAVWAITSYLRKQANKGPTKGEPDEP